MFRHVLPLNPLSAELSPICHLLALLGTRHILHVSGLRVKSKKTGDVRRVQLKCYGTQ